MWEGGREGEEKEQEKVLSATYLAFGFYEKKRLLVFGNPLKELLVGSPNGQI